MTERTWESTLPFGICISTKSINLTILDSGICKMGNGGGFRIVVFRGGGYLKNQSDRGFENWCCSGKQTQKDNVIYFEPW